MEVGARTSPGANWKGNGSSRNSVVDAGGAQMVERWRSFAVGAAKQQTGGWEMAKEAITMKFELREKPGADRMNPTPALAEERGMVLQAVR